MTMSSGKPEMSRYVYGMANGLSLRERQKSQGLKGLKSGGKGDAGQDQHVLINGKTD